MFSFLKKKPVDETREEQLEDLSYQYDVLASLASANLDAMKRAEVAESLSAAAQIRDLAASGLDCDALPNATGEFGRSIANPIPVNGVLGELKYLSRLLCRCGKQMLFHRLASCCFPAQGDTETTRDVYEAVCRNGVHWDVLFLHMYHPRRSTLYPRGYTARDYNPVFLKVPAGFGTNHLDQDFPFGLRAYLEDFLRSRLGTELGATACRVTIGHYEADIKDRSRFVRPPEHLRNLKAAAELLGSLDA
jgi:hypothetical protein